MIDGIRFKVCGLTSLVDADFADRCGADYLGFIFYPESPRHISLVQFRAMQPQLPPRKKVAVSVMPTVDELGALADAGADFFQVHFPHDTPVETIRAWSQTVGSARLWLAPRLPPHIDVAGAWLPLAGTFLHDKFHSEKFGGTSEASDWEKFVRQRRKHPQKTWILSGGLGPDNIGAALEKTGAKFIDVNSGVESAPGVKDTTKLKKFVVALHHARAESGS